MSPRDPAVFAAVAAGVLRTRTWIAPPVAVEHERRRT